MEYTVKDAMGFIVFAAAVNPDTVRRINVKALSYTKNSRKT
jgi:hypothetical protein